jgi:hypothetical protein
VVGKVKGRRENPPVQCDEVVGRDRCCHRQQRRAVACSENPPVRRLGRHPACAGDHRSW